MILNDERNYQYGHIQNAINLPLQTFQNLDLKLLERLKGTVIIYCNGIGCGTAFHAARALQKQGVESVQVYSEGWPEWRTCRLPIDPSPNFKKELQNEWNRK